TTATRLWSEPGGPHHGSPDKEPAVRLRVLEDHMVRQWYPSFQEHRVIWHGPYIKGPVGVPLMMGEKAYLVDS
ncbi:hypothetical protein ACWCQQ_50220, partial [Streptomyces sp. NPDC002143]